MYENENYDSSYNSVYQTSSSGPEMRLNEQMVSGNQKNPKKQGGAGKYFKKVLASVSFGLCFGLFAGLGIYAVDQSTGMFSGMLQADENSVRDAVKEVLASGGIANVVSQEESPSGISLTKNVTAVTTDVSEVVKEVMPAMVSIINNYVEEVSYFGQTMKQQGSASGSGIIVGENDTELLIATNYHVVQDAVSLIVNFIDGSNAEAVVKGSDKEMDLAVLAIPLSSLTEETKNAISIAKLGDSDSLKLGEPVIAIGNALGYGQSVSGGYVSALNREIELSDGSTGTFIQTDAAINPGNSGGALLNINGEVIGINSSKIGGSVVEGMGFAIPISAAQPILEELMAKETRSQVAEEPGYLGIRPQTVTEEDAERYGMPRGIFVYEVIENSAASQAGILKGDIITKFDSTRITSYSDLEDVLQYYGAGETVTITVARSENGEYTEIPLTITLASKPAGNS